MELAFTPEPTVSEPKVEHQPDIVHWGCEYAWQSKTQIAMCGEDCTGHPVVENNDPSLDCAMCRYEAERVTQVHLCPLTQKHCSCAIRSDLLGLLP